MNWAMGRTAQRACLYGVGRREGLAAAAAAPGCPVRDRVCPRCRFPRCGSRNT